MLLTPTAFYIRDDAPQLSSRGGFSFDESSPYSSTVSWIFTADGRLRRTAQGATATVSNMEWWSAGVTGGIGSSYDVRCSVINWGEPAFTAEAAAIGTYIQMSVDRTWTLTSTTVGGKQISAHFQIVATGDTKVLAECDLGFAVENGVL